MNQSCPTGALHRSVLVSLLVASFLPPAMTAPVGTEVQVAETPAADWIVPFGKIALIGESCQFEQDLDHLGFYHSIAAFKTCLNKCAVNFIDTTGRRQAEEKCPGRNKRISGHLHYQNPTNHQCYPKLWVN